MKTKVLAISILLLLVTSLALAQTPGNPLDQKSKEALRELYKEVRDWAQSNVIPKMKEWKAKLDNAMTPEDLQALNKLRDEAAQMKKKAKRITAAIAKAWRNNNFGDVRMYAAKLKELKKGRDDLLKDLKPLGVKYKGTLEEIGGEAKPYGKEWKEEFKKIVKGWYEAHKNDLSVGFKRVLAKAVDRLKLLAGMDETLKAKLAAARFMLWDGQDLPEVSELLNDENPDSEEANTTMPEGYVLESNYPNPFNPSTTISFEIPQAEHVSLVVYDVLGKEVATLIDLDLGAGSHSVVFDAKNLASGTYIYRIRAGDFVQEKKMQLVK